MELEHQFSNVASYRDETKDTITIGTTITE